ncbi:MAG: hypothetical protein LBQ94_09915 [Treponema sp.]|jgi:hypothetical protein|nr:hypothetical protein [Treponema sp.]
MGQIMEAVFCAAYLLFTGALGVVMLHTADGNKLRLRFGILTLVLVGGDAFHLVPRIYGAITGTTAELYAALGFGTLVTSITMTVFYILLWEFWLKQTDKPRSITSIVVYALALCRIALCLFPQNDWFSANPPLAWGIYRNIPFVFLGGMIAYEFFRGRNTAKSFNFAWLAVALSFLFYIPVVLFADAIPIIGMLMLPKTACYVWIVVMGYRGTR